jgi:hypothetical protein
VIRRVGRVGCARRVPAEVPRHLIRGDAATSRRADRARLLASRLACECTASSESDGVRVPQRLTALHSSGRAAPSTRVITKSCPRWTRRSRLRSRPAEAAAATSPR